MPERSPAVGVFEDRQEAERAVEQLRSAGFQHDQIGFAMPGEGEVREEGETKAGEVAVGGGLTGTVLGGLIGAAATALVPGVGPILAGGVLAGALTGAATGAAAGGLAGALVGIGIPKDEAEYYDSEFKAGRTVVTVKADSRYDEATRILRRYGAREAGAAGTPDFSTMRTEEARMTSGKRDDNYTEDPEHVDLREDQVRMEREPVVTEEITVGKRQMQETKHVSDTVRGEEAEVEEEGHVERRG